MVPKTSMKKFLSSNLPVETQQKLDYYIKSKYPNIDLDSQIFFEKGFESKKELGTQTREFLFWQESEKVIVSTIEEYHNLENWFMKGLDLDTNEVSF